MTPDIAPSTIASIFSALAAVGSAVAAWKSYSLASTAAARADEQRRRIYLRDVEETVRTVEVEAQRAETLLTTAVKPLLDSVFAISGAYGGSGYDEAVTALDKKRMRIAEIRNEVGPYLSALQAGAGLHWDALADRLPALRAIQREIESVLDDVRAQHDALANERLRVLQERLQENLQFRSSPPLGWPPS